MGGIGQCPVCGDVYYGDERDDWNSCRCGPPNTPEQVAAYRAEHERALAEEDACWRKLHAVEDGSE